MENESGFQPSGFRVVIKPDPVEERTASGLILPDETFEREEWAQVKGLLVAIGGAAFDRLRPPNDPNRAFSPDEARGLVPGTRIYFSKYAGTLFTGADGEEYRICNDKDVAGLILKEGAGASGLQGRNKGGLAAA